MTLPAIRATSLLVIERFRERLGSLAGVCTVASYNTRCTRVDLVFQALLRGRFEVLRRADLVLREEVPHEVMTGGKCVLGGLKEGERLEYVHLRPLELPRDIRTRGRRTMSSYNSCRTSTPASVALWANRVTSSRRTSTSPPCISMGGKPLKSPKSGLA